FFQAEDGILYFHVTGVQTCALPICANGVILITTKRGKYSQSTKIDLNLYSGRAKAIRLWELTTGEEHSILVNEYFRNIGKEEPFRPVSEGGRGLPSEQQTYDRLSEAFR